MMDEDLDDKIDKAVSLAAFMTEEERRELVKIIKYREDTLLAHMLELLKKIKREGRPEFAERIETHLRRNNLLPPDDDARQ
jgi:hypothetical protein